MRKTFAMFFVLLLVCSIGWAEKPYKRAMYFNGGGLNFAKFVGMYYGAKDAKKEPDLVIGICGGSLAASIVSKFDTQEAALKFLTSPEMHQMFLNIGTTKWAKTQNAAGLFVSMFYKKLVKSQRRAGIKDKYIMDVPQKLGIKEFEATLDTAKIGIIIPTTIVLGTRDGKLPQKKRDWKFQPVYYTDKNTASHLKRMGLLKTFLKNDYPDAPVMDEVICKTGVKFEDAFRGSISDPFLMSPHSYDGYLHLTGAMDASPLEMIEGLADEVFYLSSRLFNGLATMFFADAFLFDPNYRYIKQEMLKEGKYAYYLDTMDCTGKYNLTPGFASLREGVKSTTPKDYKEFVKIILYQFELGYKATQDAIRNKGKTSHLKYDFYKELKGKKYRKYADQLKKWLESGNQGRRP